MKPETKARLKLNKETLRGLSERQLRDVAGGNGETSPCYEYTQAACPPSVPYRGHSLNTRC